MEQEESTYVVTGAGQVIVGHSLVEHSRGEAGVGMEQVKEGH